MFVNRRGGVGYRRCWAGAWQMTGLRDARLWAWQGHQVADTGRDVTRRDRATDPTAHDPATGDTARDDHSRRRVRRRAIPQATSLIARDQATGYPAATGHPRRSDRRRTIRHAMIISCPTMPGNARKCPEYVRTMFGYSR
jgi:hypothetical protein